MDHPTLFFGAIINVLLVGIVLSQTATYYSIYRRTDKALSLYLFIPVLVGLLLVAAGLHVASTYVELFTPPRGQTVNFLRSAGSWIAIPSLLLAECWLLRRTHHITQSTAVTVLGAGLVLSATGFEVLGAIYTTKNDLNGVRRWTLVSAWTTAAVVLVLNAAAVFSLARSRREAVSSRVHYVLSALIRNAVLGALPVVLGAVGLGIASTAYSRTYLYLPFAEALPALLGCSVLYSLNARQQIALHSSTLTSPLRPLFSTPPIPCNPEPTRDPDRRGSLGVLIDRFKLDLPTFPALIAPLPHERRGSRELEKQPILSVYQLHYSGARIVEVEGEEMERRWSQGSSAKSERARVGFVV